MTKLFTAQGYIDNGYLDHARRMADVGAADPLGPPRGLLDGNESTRNADCGCDSEPQTPPLLPSGLMGQRGQTPGTRRRRFQSKGAK